MDALSKAWVLRPLACWNCGFDSRQQHACLSLVIVMFCQVEVSAPGCCVSECDREAATMRRSTACKEGGGLLRQGGVTEHVCDNFSLYLAQISKRLQSPKRELLVL